MLKQIIKLFISFLITFGFIASSFANSTIYKIQCEPEKDRRGLAASFQGLFPVLEDSKEKTKVVGYIDNLVLYKDRVSKKEADFTYNKNNIAVEGEVSYEAQTNIFTLKLTSNPELQIDEISIDVNPRETSYILTLTGDVYYTNCYFTDEFTSKKL